MHSFLYLLDPYLPILILVLTLILILILIRVLILNTDPPAGLIRLHSIEYAGKSVKDKLAELRETLESNKAHSIVR